MPRQLEDFEFPDSPVYRQELIYLGITVKEAAAALDMNACHLSLVLRGKRRLCKNLENQLKKYIHLKKQEAITYAL